MKRLLAPALAALAAALILPAAAGAAVVRIDGSPLDVFLGANGSLQARFDGITSGEFFPSSSDQGNAGFQLGLDVAEQSPSTVSYGGFTPVSQSAVGGAGTEADPLHQVTVFSTSTNGGATLQIEQTARYVHGSQRFSLHWRVTNTGTATTTVRPTLFADLYVSGSDSGVGFLTAGPPRVVGGINQEAGASGGILETTPWARYEEGQYGTVHQHSLDTSAGGGLTNSILSDLVDNGAAVQWPDATLRGGESAEWGADWRFTRFQGLVLDPAEAKQPVRSRHAVKVVALGDQGVPAQNTTIRYDINGVNPASGAVTTGADGAAQIAWTGRTEGVDLLDAYADLDGDGIRDGNEPQRQATVEWLAPELGRSVAVEPERGTVLVKLPPGASAARYGLKADASQSKGGFIPLTGAAELPVKTIVNANRGQLSLTSASNTKGGVQRASFYSGTFQIVQRRARRPVTEMVLKGGSFRGCPRTRSKRSSTGEPSADAARRSSRRGKRVRRLWGNGKGRFRTRGRYSSATVRGTKWVVQDHCNGTLTKLPKRPRSSKVTVRDLVARRTLTLRAGRSYFAYKRGSGPARR